MNVTSEVEIFGNESYNVSNGLDCGGELHSYRIWERVLIVIIAVFLSLTTVVGNIMVMISFKIDKQLQTISNYFLFSLAVADFAIGLISMPLFTLYTVLGYWPLGPHICDTWLALDYLASNASVLNLLIISFDRYFSVTRPLTYRAKRTTSRAAIMIGMHIRFLLSFLRRLDWAGNILDVCVSRCFNICDFEYLDIWVPRYLNIRILDYSYIYISEYLFRYLDELIIKIYI